MSLSFSSLGKVHVHLHVIGSVSGRDGTGSSSEFRFAGFTTRARTISEALDLPPLSSLYSTINIQPSPFSSLQPIHDTALSAKSDIRDINISAHI
jgi:hypothetical protein